MRRSFNKMIQLMGMLAAAGVGSVNAFRSRKNAELDSKPETKGQKVSFSQYATGIQPDNLSFKRVKGKWRVKR
jgi:hypothetical protein